MIEPRQVRERASKLFYDIKRRSAPKFWKKGRHAGKVRSHGMPVPYTSDEFANWLLQAYGCNCFLCPYCNAPIDVLTMTLDHVIALEAGGGNEFENLAGCCSDCNVIKGKLSGEQYCKFRLLLRQLHPAAEADILQRMRSAGLGMKLARQLRAGQLAKQKPIAAQEEEVF